MSGIRYGLNNPEVWERLGLVLGFASTGHLTFCCLECGDQYTADPGERSVSIPVLIEALNHTLVCPRKPKVIPEGPLYGDIVEKGKYKFFTAPEGNNDAEQDCA